MICDRCGIGHATLEARGALRLCRSCSEPVWRAGLGALALRVMLKARQRFGEPQNRAPEAQAFWRSVAGLTPAQWAERFPARPVEPGEAVDHDGRRLTGEAPAADCQCRGCQASGRGELPVEPLSRTARPEDYVCGFCGTLHGGTALLRACPGCGEALPLPDGSAGRSGLHQYACEECGAVHLGRAPERACPDCGAFDPAYTVLIGCDACGQPSYSLQRRGRELVCVTCASRDRRAREGLDRNANFGQGPRVPTLLSTDHCSGGDLLINQQVSPGRREP